jgi:hypothetical protein
MQITVTGNDDATLTSCDNWNLHSFPRRTTRVDDLNCCVSRKRSFAQAVGVIPRHPNVPWNEQYMATISIQLFFFLGELKLKID